MAYDKFNSFAAAAKRYSRRRKPQHFILAPGCPALAEVICNTCGKSLADDDAPIGFRGNRCIYLPTTRTFIAQHYTCSWETVMQAVYKP